MKASRVLVVSMLFLAGCSGQPFSPEQEFSIPDPQADDDLFGGGDDETVYGTVSYDFLRWTLTDVLGQMDPTAPITLPNPSVENGTTGFTAFGGATISQSTTAPYVGANALSLTLPTNATALGNGVRLAAISVSGLQPTITFRFRARSSTGSAVFRVRIRCRDAFGNTITAANGDVTHNLTLTVDTTYTEVFDIAYPIPSGAVTPSVVEVEIGNVVNDPAYTIFLDDFRFTTQPACRLDANGDSDTIDLTDTAIVPCPLNNPVAYLDANRALLGEPVYSDDPNESVPPGDLTAAGYKAWILSVASACGRMASTSSTVLFPDGPQDFDYAFQKLLGRHPTQAEVSRLLDLQNERWSTSNAPSPTLVGAEAFTPTKKAAAACTAILSSLEYISES